MAIEILQHLDADRRDALAPGAVDPMTERVGFWAWVANPERLDLDDPVGYDLCPECAETARMAGERVNVDVCVLDAGEVVECDDCGCRLNV